jgi:hypothetical protein
MINLCDECDRKADHVILLGGMGLCQGCFDRRGVL